MDSPGDQERDKKILNLNLGLLARNAWVDPDNIK